MNKFLIFDFATKYRLKHATISNPKEFKLTESDYNDFVAFIADKDYDYVSKSEKTLEDLKEISEKDNVYSDIKSEFETLKLKLAHNKKADLQKYKSGIIQLLTEEIVARYYYQTGKIQTGLEADIDVKKALEVLKDKTMYSSILNANYKIPMKNSESENK
jgi:carboxyl-terminal processing protease